ncbi:ImmA/IrrE family metallo-endopeptidase [Microbacterium sp. 1.5R]|uniref:ImmA/IrrE family metallo-endopeptidase n=1 Tax=Microbacterium sp. 1.5R TaxID=1916917 RepID=UPI0011A633E4|nr:ImmA/IrrE family metallo-endopeptidase [Microbacterium sp. 1.5R]
MDQLLRLVEIHGLRLVERSGGSRGGYEPRTATIRVSPGMSERTRCSVIAHELGHAMLGHEHTLDPVQRGRQERRADEWAARLLITPSAYAEAEAARDGHPASIAFDLGVTVDLVLAYQRLLRRVGDATYVAPRLGRGQWSERVTAG